MDEFIEIGTIDEFPVGSASVRVINDRRVAFFHISSGLYAADNTCPHRGGPLGEGDLIGNEIVCPWHLWSFDVRTGRTEIDGEVFVQTHEVRVDDGRVFIRMAEAVHHEELS